MLRSLRLPFLFVLLGSGCQCAFPFDQTITMTVETEVGGSSTCEQGENDVDDGNGHFVSEGEFGEVHYDYQHDGTSPPPTDPAAEGYPTYCRVDILSWLGTLADMQAIQDEVDTEVTNQGFDPTKATISFENAVFAQADVKLATASGANYDLSNMGPYHAHLNVESTDASVEDILVIGNDAGGALDAATITYTDKGAETAAILTAGLNGDEGFQGTGVGDVQFDFADLGTLTNDGEDAPILTITVDVQLAGTIHYTVP